MDDSFRIAVSDGRLTALRSRLASTDWSRSLGSGWDLGTDPGYLRELCRYWAEGFDWRAQESRLNRVPQRRMTVDGVAIHLVHARATDGRGTPLLLGHGWPSAFVEYLPLVPLLTDPAAHGLTGPSFDVIIPSLPGYGFSERPLDRVWDYAGTAMLWHRMMQQLGYRRFAAGGGDFGSGIATMMALQHPDRLIGLHLSNLDIEPRTDDAASPLSAAETAYLASSTEWWSTEGGYKAIQSTKPQTLAFALSDSPVGLAAWIVEKWNAWGDTRDGVAAHYSIDDLLTVISLYWFTGTIGTSMLDYRDNRLSPPNLTSADRVAVPTGIAVFADPAGTPPRELVERLYEVARWTRMPHGGHFAAMEEPLLLATDILDFFATLDTAH